MKSESPATFSGRVRGLHVHNNEQVFSCRLRFRSTGPFAGRAQREAHMSGTLHDRYSILVHGGAFTDRIYLLGNTQLELIRSVVTHARDALAGGAAALDVVVESIVKLEDSGLLDAGKGSFRNAANFTEMDAALMEGHTGNGGAVAAMQRLKNPIRAARIVLEKTPHVLFAGPVGEEIMVGLGAESVDDPATYFVPCATPNKKDVGGPALGTVGAVALDRYGHLAAGTSTGGDPGKMPGRVGDTPIIGASTFANERYAISATGLGERFILRSVARDIAMRSEYRNMPLQAAADYVIEELIGRTDRADGAIIAIGHDGEIVLSGANIAGMPHGYASRSADVTVGFELA
nr:MAG: isoaspartyl peptidase/L-asparaginase [Hyphomicrobiales bacterium]